MVRVKGRVMVKVEELTNDDGRSHRWMECLLVGEVLGLELGLGSGLVLRLWLGSDLGKALVLGFWLERFWKMTEGLTDRRKVDG